MCSSGDDREQAQHMGATERNGPGQGTVLGSTEDSRISTNHEATDPIQDDGDMATQGNHHVGEGMEYLDPTSSASFSFSCYILHTTSYNILYNIAT